MQVCGADIINALSSTPTRLYADTWAVALKYGRYIKQTVSICYLLRTPPQIGNGLLWRWLGFALARAPLWLGRALWLYDSARRALRLLPLVNLGWVYDHSGVITARPRTRVQTLPGKTDPFDGGKMRCWNLPGQGSGQGLVPLPCSCCWS